MAGKRTADEADVRRVFDAWRALRPRPELCKLTPDRSKLIADRLAGRSSADLVALIEYVHTADDKWCAFMRDGGYTGLDSLLRRAQLDDRIERALLWKESAAAQARAAEQLDRTGVDLGALGALRHRPPGEA